MTDIPIAPVRDAGGPMQGGIRSRRGIVRLVAAVGIIGVAAALILPTFEAASGYPTVNIFETLTDPVVVIGGDEHGLLLADGRQVGLPGVARLPAASLMLDRATTGGVEVTTDGRVVGLLPIRHRCSSGPTCLREARVDLAHLVMYFGEVEVASEKLRAIGERKIHPAFEFSERGWWAASFEEFAAWSKRASALGL